jgi:fructose-1,6-bisphosphatase I
MRPSTPPINESLPGITLERHIQEQQRQSPDATGELTGLFQQIALASKIIASKVSRAGLAGMLGLTGDMNVQGEFVQKLDEFANDTLVSCVETGGYVCVMGSEEVEEPVPVPKEFPTGKYVLLFDPLDGSGNIDINASIGTIFSIYRRKSSEGPGTLDDLLQPGRDIVGAGYVIYGSSNMVVYSTGHGVHGFTLDPSIGEYFLSHENIRMPKRGEIYSINEGYQSRWAPGVKGWCEWIKSPSDDGTRPYRLRYIGAMVADFHRTLLRGGIFAYPSDSKNASGKLRLLYEAAPMAFLAEAAGGSASDGAMSIREVMPTCLHQRTPLYIGSRDDVQDAIEFVSGQRTS